MWKRIEKSAFAVCGLRSIVIPSSVIILNESSFYGCESLESVECENGSQLEPQRNRLMIDDFPFDDLFG
jgi:hypothetical protein